MRIKLTLRPGQRGTKKLVSKYGDRLVCVRYRYDEERRKRYKTVELIIEEGDWEPKPSRVADDAVVCIKVGYTEKEVRSRVKRAGGWWDPAEKVWALRYDRVVALGLEDRIVEGGRI